MREFTCIGCPMGCSLRVEVDDRGSFKVSGNSCPVGEGYAIKECTNPTRVLTTSVLVHGGRVPTVSVKSAKPLPKGSLLECARLLKGFYTEAPVKIGDVIYRDIMGTGIDIVATRNADKK